MHSSSRGKHGSKRPAADVAPTWLRYKGKEVELLVVKLAKEGKTPSVIGMLLRDVYGVPDIKQVTGKTLGDILIEKKLASKLPEDMIALIRKAIAVTKHHEANPMDTSAHRGISLTEAKLQRLAKYYKSNGKLDTNWKYDREKAGLYLE